MCKYIFPCNTGNEPTTCLGNAAAAAADDDDDDNVMIMMMVIIIQKMRKKRTWKHNIKELQKTAIFSTAHVRWEVLT